MAKDEIESCYAEVPGFADDACLLHDWVAFGLASQRGDDEWRSRMRERLAGSRTEARLARAVVLSWGHHRNGNRPPNCSRLTCTRHRRACNHCCATGSTR
nr:hypothetical protein [Halomonas elongata]